MKLNRSFFIFLSIAIIGLILYTNIGIKEMDHYKVWDNAYNDLNMKDSFSIQEDIELKYNLNNKEYKQIDRTIMSLVQNPYLQKKVTFSIKDDIADNPEQKYLLEEDHHYYIIDSINGVRVKNEITPRYFRQNDETAFSFIMNHIPLFMERNAENKYEYKLNFKLSQYQEKYHHIFDKLINEVKQEFNTTKAINVIDEELTLIINFNDKYQFSKITLDLTNVLKPIVQGIANIKDYHLVYQYTFSNFNSVTIDQKEYTDNVIKDNAPNEIKNGFVYETHSSKTKTNGKFEYNKDIDIYTLTIKGNVKYQFKVDTNANFKLSIVNEDKKEVNYDSFIENKSYTYSLTPGNYYLIIENKDLEAADYTIETIDLIANRETALK